MKVIEGGGTCFWNVGGSRLTNTQTLGHLTPSGALGTGLGVVEEISQWGRALRVYSLPLLPVLTLLHACGKECDC